MQVLIPDGAYQGAWGSSISSFLCCIWHKKCEERELSLAMLSSVTPDVLVKVFLQKHQKHELGLPSNRHVINQK